MHITLGAKPRAERERERSLSSASKRASRARIGREGACVVRAGEKVSVRARVRAVCGGTREREKKRESRI